MSEHFDPYHRWLGIAPEEQPANHYRLLGLKQFEGDADVIESAADRQMAHVRGFQSGEHAGDAQRVLNEISGAKLVLLNAEQKTNYDGQLRAKSGAAAKVNEPKMAQALPLASAASVPPPKRPPPKPTAAASSSPTKSSGLPIALFVAVPVVILLLVVGGAVALFAIRWGSHQAVARNDVDNGPAEAISHPVVPTSNQPEPTATDETDREPQVDPPPADGAGKPPSDLPDPEPPVPVENIDPPIVVDPIPPDDTDVIALAPDAELPVSTDLLKFPVPGKAERDAARAKIDGIFSIEDAQTRAEKAALVDRLFKVAGDTKDDSVAQFVLLNMARELAAENAQARLAMRAVDLLQANFDFDTDPVRMATLGAAVKSPVAPTEKKEVVVVGMEMIDGMMLRDEYEAAGKLSVALLDIARRARDRTLLEALIQRRTRAGELLTAYTKAQSAMETLKSDPDNADANLLAGKFYLFAKSDWGRALPLLAKGSDTQFAAAARGEIEKPKTPKQEQDLANAWWTLAEAEEDAVAKRLLQSRAMAWYQRAAPQLSGLDKAAAVQKLTQLADGGIRPMALDFSAPQPSAAQVINLLEGIDPAQDSFNGQWRFRDGKLLSPIAKHSRCRIPFAPPPEYRIEMEVEPLDASSKTLVLGLATQGPRKFAAALDSWQGKKIAGLEFVDGKQCFENETRFEGPVLVANEKNQIVCTVRPGGVVLSVNDREIVNWQGDPSRLSMEDKWDVPDESALSVGAYESPFVIHSMTLTPLGEAARERPRPIAPPLEDRWIQLFNGRDLTGWKVKIKDQQLGDNYQNTFRVKDGAISVAYDNYRTFDEKFGHLFYETPYSNYTLRVEYRFTGQQCAGAPKWAHRNSGVLVHSQSPESMKIGQDFPNCIEVQLVGGNGRDARPTANLCTTGTHVVMNGRLYTTHSTKSASKTYHGDQWVTVEVEVRGSESIRHIVDGEVVLQYAQPQLDNGRLLEGGYIALQAKGHPVEFRKVEIKPLDADVGAALPPRTDGLIAHWKFDEGRGEIARDSAGGHHGTVSGGTWIRGAGGNAISFDGKDDMVEIPLADALNITGRITLSAWVRARSLRTKTGQHNVFTSIIDQADQNGATFLRYIDRGEGPNYSTGAYQPGKHTHQALRQVPRTDVGQWVHLAGVYDGAAWRLYRNGREVAVQKTEFGARGRPVHWRIGGAGDPDQPFFFHGDIDDVRIYNRALSAEDVGQLAAIQD